MMIRVSEPFLPDASKAAAIDAINTNFISSSGPYVAKFEQSWASYCQRLYGISVTNGTAALELLFEQLNLPPSSEVILPSFTIISCAQAIVKSGLRPVFVDCDPNTFCITAQNIRDAITEYTSCVLIVHMYGHSCDMDPILEVCNQYSIQLVEDAAQVHGGKYKGRPLGSFGVASCFSFFANKLITTGEGGMILTNDKELNERLLSSRNLCFRPEKRFTHDSIGSNLRLNNVSCALGHHQVLIIDQIVNRKREIARYYSSSLATLKSIRLPIEESYSYSVNWVYPLLLLGDNGPELRIRLIDYLYSKDIETRTFFYGLSVQPPFHSYRQVGSLPITSYIEARGLYIPSGLGITQEEQEYVSSHLHRFFDHYL